MGTIWRCNIGFCSKNPNFHLFHDLEKLKSPDSPFKNSGISLWKTWKFSPRRTLKKSQFWINGWIGKIYLNPIKFRAPLIFAQLNNSYIRALKNLYFRVSLRYDRFWFCPNTGKYRYDFAHIRENTGLRKPVFRHITRSERTGVECQLIRQVCK